MAAIISRNLITPRHGYTGVRTFTSAVCQQSGHSRWSKIKHDKAREDAKTNRQRSTLAHELILCSRQFGPDPSINPKLSTLIAGAKKAGFPKASIENAIARGQGKSREGASLEAMNFEALVSSVAVLAECQTDSKNRTLQDLRLIVREFGGVPTSTSHFFERKGKIVFEKAEGIVEEDVLEQAIEAGALDVEVEEDGKIIVFTEPNQTTSTADSIAASMGLKVESSDLVWEPKPETSVDVVSPDVLMSFISRLEEDPSVQNVYVNAN